MSILKPEKTRQYALYKYDAQEVLLLHRMSKIVYQYFEVPCDNPEATLTQKIIVQNELLKMHIEQPIPFQNGMLFEKQLTTLAKQLNQKRRMFSNKQANSMNYQQSSYPYQQQQLVNTIMPIIQAVNIMKQLKVNHGNICPQTIIVSRTGEIMLRNINSKDKCKYYPDQKQSIVEDFKAIGYIMLECLTLKAIEEILSYSNIQEIFKKTFSKNNKQYSKAFLVGVYSLISQKLKTEIALKLIIGEIPDNIQTDIQKIYQTISRDSIKITPIVDIYRQKNYCEDIKITHKPINTAHSKVKQLKGKLIKATQKPLICEDIYLKKTSQIQTGNNLNFINKKNFEDTQNKKVAQEVKKKHMERIAKIIQRSNAFSNQLAKKAHDSALKKMSNSKIITGNDETQKQINTHLKKMHPAKQDTLKFSSSQKRLVSASKNKNLT